MKKRKEFHFRITKIKNEFLQNKLFLIDLRHFLKKISTKKTKLSHRIRKYKGKLVHFSTVCKDTIPFKILQERLHL